MNFKTEIQITRSRWDITYDNSLILIGSCFSDHIGELLDGLKFNVLSNPFGVVYNPESMAAIIERALYLKKFNFDELVLNNGLYHLMDLHSDFSDVDKNKVIEHANETLENVNARIKSATYIMVTFGTAYVYRDKATGHTVGNCHKLPASNFTRTKLSVDEVVELWKSLIEKIQKVNPAVKIIYTISPVRHFSDGAHENQLSKSTLLLAFDILSKKYFPQNMEYFPSYELVMDELRDYRFYAEDMLHINNLAVRFIFDKFKSCYFPGTTNAIAIAVNKIISAYNHRIMNNNKSEIIRFAKNMLGEIEKLQRQEPSIFLKKEKEYFDKLIADSN